ncbi:MAG: glycosyltransferase [Alcanivorax sp.]|nr:glycosyltransferase [Alcanivorax sp.]
MKKRVCMLITDAVSFNVLCRGQLEFFRDNYDVDLTLVCGGSIIERDILKERSVGKVVYIPFRRQPALFHDFWCLLRLLLFFLFNRFDVIVYSTPKVMLLAAVASFCTLQRKRISVIRGRVYEDFLGLKRKFYILLDKIVICLSTDNVSISGSLRKAYIDDGFNGCDISVLGMGSSNGVDLDRFCISESSKKKRDGFVVGVVGRICKDKGIEQIEEVISYVKSKRPDIDFIFVGSIDDEAGSTVIRRLLAGGLATHIPHTSNIQELFASFDLHLFLSHREGFGNVAIEAAACSIPTFAFDVVGVRDSVRDGVSGIVFDFLDSNRVSEAILEYADDPHRFGARFVNARKWAAENFEQKAVWKGYLDFYLR